MNRAATVVLAVLAFMVVAFTIRVVAVPMLPELSDKSLRFFDVALGALIGVIGKTGYDAAKREMEDGEKGEQQTS